MNKNYIDNAGNCCKTEQECEKITETPCGSQAKQEYEEYLRKEACKPEPEICYDICDYDPNEIYFMQYRSKKAFYNEWWKKDLYKDPYNIRAHKFKTREE